MRIDHRARMIVRREDQRTRVAGFVSAQQHQADCKRRRAVIAALVAGMVASAHGPADAQSINGRTNDARESGAYGGGGGSRADQIRATMERNFASWREGGSLRAGEGPDRSQVGPGGFCTCGGGV